ncbi:hypothetical protein BKA80DRAFT_277914 [Phyllosticta citrichinensis]
MVQRQMWMQTQDFHCRRPSTNSSPSAPRHKPRTRKKSTTGAEKRRITKKIHHWRRNAPTGKGNPPRRRNAQNHKGNPPRRRKAQTTKRIHHGAETRDHEKPHQGVETHRTPRKKVPPHVSTNPKRHHHKENPANRHPSPTFIRCLARRPFGAVAFLSLCLELGAMFDEKVQRVILQAVVGVLFAKVLVGDEVLALHHVGFAAIEVDVGAVHELFVVAEVKLSLAAGVWCSIAHTRMMNFEVVRSE